MEETVRALLPSIPGLPPFDIVMGGSHKGREASNLESNHINARTIHYVIVKCSYVRLYCVNLFSSLQDIHDRLVYGSDYPVPAINIVVHTGKLVR